MRSKTTCDFLGCGSAIQQGQAFCESHLSQKCAGCGEQAIRQTRTKTLKCDLCIEDNQGKVLCTDSVWVVTDQNDEEYAVERKNNTIWVEHVAENLERIRTSEGPLKVW